MTAQTLLILQSIQLKVGGKIHKKSNKIILSFHGKEIELRRAKKSVALLRDFDDAFLVKHSISSEFKNLEMSL